jgi:hypothetical protein
VFKPPDDEARKAAAELCRQHIVNDVRELIELAVTMQARTGLGETPDDVSQKRFRDAQEHLLEAVQLGMSNGLSRLDVHATITDAARGERTTEEARMALYKIIKSIGGT